MKRLLAIALVVMACSPTPAAPPTAAPAPDPELVTFSGDNDADTAPFELAGDTYVSTWKKEPGCTFGAYLKSPTDESFSRSLGGSYSDGPTSGETWAYHIGGPGTFYLQVQGSCDWTLTLTAG